MSDGRFQVTIVGSEPEVGAEDSKYKVTPHSRGGAVVDRIDDLARIWDQVVSKLTGLAAQSSVAAAASRFELNEIEFNIGIEAGLNVGLVTKGEASVTIKFARLKEGEPE